jgi:hypothetical protein
VSDKLVSNSAPAAIDGDSRVLVVVPCGRSKLWDREPDRGSVFAAEAHTGTPFRLNRQYAERFGDAWVVLSAKYGFVALGFLIPAPYEISVKYPAISPITFHRLRRQVGDPQLNRHQMIVSLWNRSCAIVPR